MILHHTLQQANFSRCSVKSVFLVQESTRFESLLHLWECRIQLRAFSPTEARRAAVTPLATTLSRGFIVANTICRPMREDSSQSRSASPGNPDNQFTNMKRNHRNRGFRSFHSFGLPRLLSVSTPRVQICGTSARDSSFALVSTPDTSSPPGMGISPGTED